MPRHFLDDADVQPLVQDLIALVLHEGSVNAAQSALMAPLASDKTEGWLYPNRLHSLLSANPTRAINTDTLQVLRLALSRLPAEVRDLQKAEQAYPQLEQDAQLAWEGAAARASIDARAKLQAAAAHLNLPPAVTQWLLRRQVGALQPPEASHEGAAPIAPPSASCPDWSFQDTAYARCLASLLSAPDRKVGLVIPTGGGKTRVAIRIALSALAAHDSKDSIVLWITHRARLRTQARRELLRAINEGTPELPEGAARLLGERVHFCMLGDLTTRLQEYQSRLAVVIVDEGHHAAADSYQPLFDHRPLRGLFLTATPNRTDLLPIGVDEISYSITPRELFERKVIIEPALETLDLFSFDWGSAQEVANFADYLLERAEDDFVKTLVAVTTVEHAVLLHSALQAGLEAGGSGGILSADDVGYVHSTGSATGADPEAFLDEFIARPRGIVVATSQLIGEGFDDPSINAVIVAYPTGSMVQLMQVGGRALRYAPDKRAAYIVQMRESPLAYHYEQRWLYQDISDELRPQLADRVYASVGDLAHQVQQLLTTANVKPQDIAVVRLALERVVEGDSFSLLLTGLPYSGPRDTFDTDAVWHAIPVSRANRELFLRLFNDFSSRKTEVNDFDDFLRNYVSPDTAPGSEWKQFKDMLWGMRYAHFELSEREYDAALARPYDPALGTTWLRYISLQYRPLLPASLAAFLTDATNREEVVRDYLASPDTWCLATKVRLPLAGSRVYLLDEAQAAWFQSERERVRSELQAAKDQSFSRVVDWRQELRSVPIPLLIVDRFDSYLRADDLADFTLALGKRND